MADSRRKKNTDPFPGRKKEGYFDDYYPREEYAPEADEPRIWSERDRYYADRDEYYARKDAYYAKMDAYYASLEEEQAAEDEEEAELRPEPRRSRKSSSAIPPKVKKKAAQQRERRRGRALRNFLTLVMAAVLLLLLFGQAPERNTAGAARETGHSTILLTGTTQDKSAADTILLLSLEQEDRTVRLLYIPGETFDSGYTVPWLRSAFSYAGGGRRGMEELLSQSTRVLGFSPDAYLMVDPSCFTRAVDLLGGVECDVPVGIACQDAILGIDLDLRAGTQTLSGAQVLSLFRYCSAYTDPGVDLTALRDDLLRSALRQWFRPRSLKKVSALRKLLQDYSVSDLTFRNWMWIVRVLSKADVSSISLELYPGQAQIVDGIPVYFPDQSAAEPILQGFSPYR